MATVMALLGFIAPLLTQILLRWVSSNKADAVLKAEGAATVTDRARSAAEDMEKKYAEILVASPTRDDVAGWLRDGSF